MNDLKNRLKGAGHRFKSSKIGWATLVTCFAVAFGFLASVVTGILAAPALLDDTFKFTDEVVSLLFPLVIFGMSFGVAKYLSKKRGLSISKTLGWRKPKKNALWLTPLLLLLYVAILIVSMSILQAVSPHLAGQEQEVAETVSSSANWSLLVMAVSVGFFTPIAEETFFRGLLLSAYSKRLKIVSSIVFVAALFGLAHGQVNVGIDTFFFGLILGTLTWKTESILPAISLHMLKNCLAVLFIISS